MRLRIALHNYVRKGRKWILAAGILGLTTVASAAMLPNLFPFLDPTGMISTYNTNGPIDESSNNPFFQSLGTNGRACGTCHSASDAFGLGVRSIRQEFFRSEDTDPLFAAVCQQAAIVNFELGLTSAQALDFRAGWLNRDGALGGPLSLSNQNYYPGTNDSLGADPRGDPFNSTAFTCTRPGKAAPTKRAARSRRAKSFSIPGR